jgi:hypothetical protein
MKRVQVTIHPGDSNLPFTFERVTEVEEPFVQVWVLNWNVSTSPASFLLQISGNWERFETIVAEDPAVDEFEMIPLSETESYCFVTGIGTADARGLWEVFKTGSLMTIPPARWNADGSYTFAIVGREKDIQRAIDGVPDGVRVDIDSVGGTKVTPDSVIGRLSSRQREAVEVAIRLGYYDPQRKATSEDIAHELDCSTSTAAEHLRKAESKIFTGLFGERVG